MDCRHEWKHEISHRDLCILRQRLHCVMRSDPHATDGVYHVRSLYFDTPADTALLEKINGINRREKFRIRYYNRDTSLIRLEKKSRWNGLSCKQSADLTAGEAERILHHDLDWMADSGRPLLQELYSKMQTTGLAPKTIVDYLREPYVFDPGHVRVTLDHEIRTALGCTGFLDPDCVTIPVPDDPILLEVKWDQFLPDLIRDIVRLENRHAAAFSKYAACRIYG